MLVLYRFVKTIRDLVCQAASADDADSSTSGSLMEDDE